MTCGGAVAGLTARLGYSACKRSLHARPFSGKSSIPEQADMAFGPGYFLPCFSSLSYLVITRTAAAICMEARSLTLQLPHCISIDKVLGKYDF